MSDTDMTILFDEREAVQQYLEEREYTAEVDDEPWWVDVGGEGEPC